MDDEIQYTWHQEVGSLYLDCGLVEFQQFVQFIKEEFPHINEVDWQEVNTIAIWRKQESEPQPKKSWKDPVALIGCGLISFMLLFIFTMGIFEIASWFSP